MEKSIIEESQAAKKRGFLGFFKTKKFFVILSVVIVAAAVIIFYPRGNNKETAQDKPKEWVVKKDDIKIALESEGKVVAEDGVELSFSVSGDTLEVSEVYVKEGDMVKKGDKIASVTTETLQFELRSAYNSYKSALDRLALETEEASDEDIQKALNSIKTAEIALNQAKSGLEDVKNANEKSIKNAEDSLTTAELNLKLNKDVNTSRLIADAYEDFVNELKVYDNTIEEVLDDSDSILGVDDQYINDDFENYLGLIDSSTLGIAKTSYILVRDSSESILDELENLSSTDAYNYIDDVADQTKAFFQKLDNHLNDMKRLLNSTGTSVSLPQTDLDSMKSTINSNSSTVKSKITAITNSLQSLENTKDSLTSYEIAYEKAKRDLEYTKQDAESSLVDAEAAVVNKEVALENAQMDYDDLITPPSELDLASIKSSLTSAAITLDKANYNLSKATITSPIDGEVAMLNYKKGDVIFSSDNEPMAIIINDKTLYIEVNIEEADISKVKVGQKADITLDAVQGLELNGEISFVSKTSSVNNNGVVTYLVRVVFENTEDSQIREGMTAFVDFVTAEVEDVLVAPVAAVRNVNDTPSIQLKSGEWKSVVTGFTDGKYVEVISGIKEGETVLY